MSQSWNKIQLTLPSDRRQNIYSAAGFPGREKFIALFFSVNALECVADFMKTSWTNSTLSWTLDIVNQFLDGSGESWTVGYPSNSLLRGTSESIASIRLINYQLHLYLQAAIEKFPTF